MVKKQIRITIRRRKSSGIWEINKGGIGIALGKTKAEANKKAKGFRKQIKRRKK